MFLIFSIFHFLDFSHFLFFLLKKKIHFFTCVNFHFLFLDFFLACVAFHSTKVLYIRVGQR